MTSCQEFNRQQPIIFMRIHFALSYKYFINAKVLIGCLSFPWNPFRNNHADMASRKPKENELSVHFTLKTGIYATLKVETPCSKSTEIFTELSIDVYTLNVLERLENKTPACHLSKNAWPSKQYQRSPNKIRFKERSHAIKSASALILEKQVENHKINRQCWKVARPSPVVPGAIPSSKSWLLPTWQQWECLFGTSKSPIH